MEVIIIICFIYRKSKANENENQNDNKIDTPKTEDVVAEIKPVKVSFYILH